MARRSIEEIKRIFRNRLEPITLDKSSDEEKNTTNEEDSFSEDKDSDEDFNIEEYDEDESELESESEDDEKHRRGRKRKFPCEKDEDNEDEIGCSVITPERSKHLTWETHSPGPKTEALNCKTVLDMWSLLFSDEMLQIIMIHTNEEIRRRRGKGKEEMNDLSGSLSYKKEINIVELRAFIGLLYYTGVENCGLFEVEELWSHKFGPILFKTAMPSLRFKFILRLLRFDNKNNYAENRGTAFLAPIQKFWEHFMKNCRKYYTPSQYMTFGKQTLGRHFKARIYIKDKPQNPNSTDAQGTSKVRPEDDLGTLLCPQDVAGTSSEDLVLSGKCGLEIIQLNDAKTNYLLNMIPYASRLRKVESYRRTKSVPNYYIRTLLEPVYNTNRNIMCYDWFISSKNADRILNKYGLKMVGQIQKNKKNNSESFEEATNFQADQLLSTLHKPGKSGQKKIPTEIVEFYNKTKADRDTFNQVFNSSTCKRRTHNWTIRLFMIVLDHAAGNACILYNFNPENELKTHRNFLKDLSIELVKPLLWIKIKNPALAIENKYNIIRILNIPGEPGTCNSKSEKLEKRNILEKRKYCFFCRTVKRQTNYCCALCKIPTCDEHRFSICSDCFD